MIGWSVTTPLLRVLTNRVSVSTFFSLTWATIPGSVFVFSTIFSLGVVCCWEMVGKGYGCYLQECENRPIGYPGTKFLPGGLGLKCTSLLAFRIVSASGAEYKRKHFPTQSLLPLCCPFCGPPEVLHLVSPSRHETRTTRQALKRLKKNTFLGKIQKREINLLFYPS